MLEDRDVCLAAKTWLPHCVLETWNVLFEHEQLYANVRLFGVTGGLDLRGLHGRSTWILSWNLSETRLNSQAHELASTRQCAWLEHKSSKYLQPIAVSRYACYELLMFANCSSVILSWCADYWCLLLAERRACQLPRVCPLTRYAEHVTCAFTSCAVVHHILRESSIATADMVIMVLLWLSQFKQSLTKALCNAQGEVRVHREEMPTSTALENNHVTKQTVLVSAIALQCVLASDVRTSLT